MSDPGIAHEKFICIDSKSRQATFRHGGLFYDGTFKDLLRRGYLDEGSMWLEKNTGKKYKVVGAQVPVWKGDEEMEPQTLEEINADE